jgi:hypothetical protein
MLIVKIDTDNDAFHDGEASRILRSIAEKVENGEATGKYQTVLDINGNDVGRWKYSDESLPI